MKLRLAFLATMSVVVGLTACGNPTSLKAGLSTSVDSLQVFALSGTPPSYPSGVLLLARQPVRVDVYEGAGHAFFADYRPTYRRGPAAELWERIVPFLAAHLQHGACQIDPLNFR